MESLGRRLIGTLLFLCPAVGLFELAGRLAAGQRPGWGWGWFVFAGLVLSGVALNLWSGEPPRDVCPACRKTREANDWG